MTKSPELDKKIFKMLFDMEGDVLDLERWAHLIEDLGTCEIDIRPTGLYVVGSEIKRVAESLKAHWKQAFELARLIRDEAPPCA